MHLGLLQCTCIQYMFHTSPRKHCLNTDTYMYTHLPWTTTAVCDRFCLAEGAVTYSRYYCIRACSDMCGHRRYGKQSDF